MIFDCLREEVQFCADRLSGCPCVFEEERRGVETRDARTALRQAVGDSAVTAG